MALTLQERKAVMFTVVGTFNASPGRTIFEGLTDDFQNGASHQEITADLVATPLFEDAYPGFQTNEEFAEEYITNLMGPDGDLVTDPGLWQAVVDLTVSWLDANVSQADTIWFLTQYMSGAYGPVIAGLEDAAQALENKVDVALYQAVDLELDIPATSLEDLRAPIADVDETQQSVDDAIAALDSYDDGEITDTVGAPGGSVDEDAELGAAVGVEASANFVNDVSYSLTDDAGGLFAIDEDTGVVTVAGALDREAAASHDITVQADNGDGDTTSADFTIDLGEVNDNDVSAIGDDNATANTVSENGSAGDSVGITASASDADVGSGDITYSLSDDAGGKFEIDPDTGVVTTTGSLDREAADNHDITVVATSDDGSSNSRTFNILVDNVNESPVATGTDLATIQDTPVDGSITATDPENDDLTYVITTPASDGSVNLNGDGTFTYVPNDGFAGDDSFAVTVADGNGGFSSPAVVTVSVGDIADVLTIGVDNVLLSGAAQVVTGNHLTYNPGDIIAGEDGAGNTLHLGLTPTAPITLGSATVTGIDNLLVNVNPADPSHLVTLLMTLWGPNSDTDPTHALDLVSIVQSLGTAFSILDLQNLATTSLNDLAGMVSIDVDHQVVAGGSDELDIILREVGTNSSSTGGRTTILTDNSVEILNITDDSLNASFASDLTVLANIGAGDNAGPGFNTVMIDGGITGVDLIIQDSGADTHAVGDGALVPVEGVGSGFASLAGTGITVDSTAFDGDLVADITGASSGTVNNGDGMDELISFSSVSGSVDTGAGADTVLLTNGSSLSGTILGGDGNDGLTVEGSLTTSSGALLDGEDGDDTLVVLGAVGSGTSAQGGAGTDNITVSGGVAGTVLGEDGADTVHVQGGITGLVDGGSGNDHLHENGGGTVTGSIVGADGNDTIITSGVLGDDTQNTSRGLLDGGAGNDTITQGGQMDEGSRILGGDGADTIVVNGFVEGNKVDGGSGVDLEPEASIEGNDGDDSITVNGVLDGDIHAGSGNDTVTLTDNHREGSIDLGDGDDLLLYLNGADFTGDVESGPYAPFTQNDGSVDGGLGNNTITMRTGTDDSSHTMEFASDLTDGSAAPWDGTDVDNIQTLNLEGVDSRTTSNVEHDQLFQIDLRAFNSDLGTINVLDDDKKVTVELDGYNGEQINWDSDGDGDQTLNILDGGDVYLAGGPWLTGAASGATSSTLNLALASTDVGGEDGFNAFYNININDDLRIATTNLTNNGFSSRSVTLDGLDQDNNAGTAGEGNSLNIDGDNTSLLTVFNSTQETVDASAYSGNLWLEVIEDEAHDITTTAQSNDWVDMTPDTVNLMDTVDLGDGDGDRLVIANSTRTLSLVDDDQFFEGVAGMEILRAAGDDGGTLLISIEDDFRSAGSGGTSQTIEVTNNGGVSGKVDIDIDADYLDDHPDPANAHLQVDARSGTVDIDNGADVDLTVDLFAEGMASLFFTDSNDAISGSGVMFTNTGSGNQVDLNITVARSMPTVIASTLLAAPTAADPSIVGHVGIDVTAGSISPNTITLVDVDEGGFADNSAITMTWDRGWSSSGLDFNVNAAGIANDDFAVFTGVTKDTDGTNTGGLTFIGVAETDHGFALEGTQNDDVLWGGQDDDHINGNDGDDEIWGDPAIGSAVLPGTQMVKTIQFANEVIDAGDSYSITIGGQTYTWVAAADYPADGTGAAAAVTAIAGMITADQSTIDGDVDTDVAATFDAGLGTLTITGVDVSDLGYDLGEVLTPTATSQDRPTAIVTLGEADGYDVGDIITVMIDGNPYSWTVDAFTTSATDAAAALAGVIQASVAPDAPMDATAVGDTIVLHGDTPNTEYTISASVTDVVPTSQTVTATYGGLDPLEQPSITFMNGTTLSAITTAQLAIDIGTTFPGAGGWTAAAPDAFTVVLTSVDVGAASAGSPVVTSVGITGGNGGATTLAPPVPGTGPTVVEADDPPTIAARALSTTFADGDYDAGDIVTVTIGANVDIIVLGAPGDAANDVNLTGDQVAAQVAAAITAPGVTATATLNAVSFDAGAGNTATFSISLVDITQTGTGGLTPSDVPEIITLDYSAIIAGATSVTATINGEVISGPDIATLIANINLSATASGVDGYNAAPGIGIDTILLTGNTDGTEPFGTAEPGDAPVSGAAISDGGAPIITPVVAVAAVPQVETFTFPIIGIGADNGYDFTIGTTLYHSWTDVGNIFGTLSTLVGSINADTNSGLTHGWTASYSGGTTIVLTGPADGSDPGLAPALDPIGGNTRVDAAVTETVGAITLPDETNGETYTVTLVPDSPGSITSFGITFDTSAPVGLDILDLTLTASSVALMVADINSHPSLADLTASWDGIDVNTMTITGPASGAGSANPPLLVSPAGDGTGSVVLTDPADFVANPWTQEFSFETGVLAATDTVHIDFSDGTEVDVPWAGSATATLTAIGAAINTALFGGAGVVTPDLPTVGEDVTVAGPDFTTVPTLSVFSLFTYDTLGAAAGVLTTPGAGAIAAMQTIDLTAWDAANESVTITFGNGESFTVAWNTDLPTSLADLAAAIIADDATNGEVDGTGNWETVTSNATELILTGPANGAAPGIGFTSAVINATAAAGFSKDFESWDNKDNDDAVITVVSGSLNTDPVVNPGGDPVAAEPAGANGNDSINGGIGEDTINGMGGSDTLNGDDGDDEINGGSGGDLINGGNDNDELHGNDGNDVVNGDSGNDTLTGDSGTDSLTGGDGNDSLMGGTGADTLEGGSGSDFLDGGRGASRDILTGGESADGARDTFRFEAGDSTGQAGAADLITDFEAGPSGSHDVIQLDLVGVVGTFFANVDNTTDLLLALNNGAPAAGRTVYDTSAGMLYIDVGGTGDVNAAMSIEVDIINGGTLVANNFAFNAI